MNFLNRKIKNFIGLPRLISFAFSKVKGEFFVNDKDGNKIVLQKS